jgi:general secretion pathway protein I
MRRLSLHTRGFTLLEVIVALAILSVSLVAISTINASAINMHTYAKRLTVATLLARGKMADIESKLQSDGLPADDEVEDGNFRDEGYPEYHWEAKIIRPKTEDINTQNLLAMTGMGLTGQTGKDQSKGSGGLDGLSSMVGSLLGTSSGSTGTDQSTMAALATNGGGLLGGAIQTQFQQMIDQLGKLIREVRLTVSWKSGKVVDQFTVVTHIVSLGPGTDQVQSDAVVNAAASSGAAQAPGANNSTGGLPGGGWQGGGGLTGGRGFQKSQSAWGNILGNSGKGGH